jgi:hypothetical protein
MGKSIKPGLPSTHPPTPPLSQAILFLALSFSFLFPFPLRSLQPRRFSVPTLLFGTTTSRRKSRQRRRCSTVQCSAVQYIQCTADRFWPRSTLQISNTIPSSRRAKESVSARPGLIWICASQGVPISSTLKPTGSYITLGCSSSKTCSTDG